MTAQIVLYRVTSGTSGSKIMLQGMSLATLSTDAEASDSAMYRDWRQAGGRHHVAEMREYTLNDRRLSGLASDQVSAHGSPFHEMWCVCE